MGRTTARVPFSECTSPSSRSAVSVPVNTLTAPLLLVTYCLQARLLTHLERLDDVVDLDVVERPQTDTALVALADLGRVVLEAAQRLDGQVVRATAPAPIRPGLGVGDDLPPPPHRAAAVPVPRAPENPPAPPGTRRTPSEPG